MNCDAQPDGPACQRWSDCRAGAVVEYREEAYGHHWEPQVTDRVWTFLKRYNAAMRLLDGPYA